MSEYRPVQSPPGPRVPVWVFGGILIGAIGLLLWLNPNYWSDAVVRPDFVISEIQASNWSSLVDADGDYSDWIEIHNPSDQSRALSGWYLTDDFKQLTKWQFPDITLEGGGFLVVFASGKNRNRFMDDLHANFRLAEQGEYLALVEPSGTRVVHEFLPKYPPQPGDDSFGIRESFFSSPERRSPGAYRATAFFDHPTPGQPNLSEYWGQVSDTHFNQGGGYMDRPFELVLDTKTPRTTIRYTLDGSMPTAETGEEYQRPLLIDHTTTIRVRAFRDHYKPSNVDTQTYLFSTNIVSQRRGELPETWGVKEDWVVPADYAMDSQLAAEPQLLTALKALPTVSLVLDQKDLFDRAVGIYANPEAMGRDWERAASVEFIYPESGKTHREACGLRVFGEWSRRPEESPKHSFRLIFREQYGAPELRHRAFGSEGPKRFRQLVLKAGFEDSWLHWDGNVRSRGQLLRDEWMRRTILASGGLASRGRFVHLFLNGLYWGIYNLCEFPDAAFMATHLGGDPSEYEARSHAGILSGDDLAWRRLFPLAGAAQEDSSLKLVDLDPLVDYLLARFMGGGWQSEQQYGWFAGRSIHPTGQFQFFMWDGGRALFDSSDRLIDLNPDESPNRLFHRWRTDPEFSEVFKQRAHAALAPDGWLGLAANQARYQQLTDDLRRAIVLESLRWGDYRQTVHPARRGPYETYLSDRHWEAESQRVLDEFFAQRHTALVEQLKAMDLW